jgi:hypothetical protein
MSRFCPLICALVSLCLLGCAGFHPVADVEVRYSDDTSGAIPRVIAALAANGFSTEHPGSAEARTKNGPNNGWYRAYGALQGIYCADGADPCRDPKVFASVFADWNYGITVRIDDEDDDGREMSARALVIYDRLVKGLQKTFGSQQVIQ